MTTETARPSRREALTSRRFVWHYLQMLAAMLAGMVLLRDVGSSSPSLAAAVPLIELSR